MIDIQLVSQIQDIQMICLDQVFIVGILAHSTERLLPNSQLTIVCCVQTMSSQCCVITILERGGKNAGQT